MDSQAGVQNFSLPNRSNSRRPFSPGPFPGSENRSASRLDMINDDNMMTSSLGDCVPVDRVHVRSPSPTALRLFHFTEDAASSMNRRSSRALPRPMSTSSSAPALGCAEHTASVLVMSQPDVNDRPGPCSPIATLWPRPLSERFDRLPGDGVDHGRHALTHSVSAREASRPAAETETARDTDESPPPIDRSISIRWGPRLRHIPMSEVQAADDAVRRIAAARRERIIFWTLVAAALIGVLSCTAAVTLAAAQAALQAGLEDVGEGGGIVWDSRTLGWLVASLILCASAAVGLVVATSTRCRRNRRLNRWRSPTPTPTHDSSSPCPNDPPKDTADNKDKDRRTMTVKSTRSLPNILSGHQGDNTKGSWVEMQDMGTKKEGLTVDTPKWWHLGAKLPGIGQRYGLGHGYGKGFGKGFGKDLGKGHAQGQYGNVNQESPETSPHGSSSETACKGTVSNHDGAADVPDEDRNWAKFSQDTAQLRRYVESLEARLAGSQDAPVGKPTNMGLVDTENYQTDSSAINTSPKRIRIRPSTSVRTITSANTATTSATGTTIQPVMGSVGPVAPHSAYSLLLPPGSPSSAVSASMVSSSSPRRVRTSSANTNVLTLGRDLGRDLTRTQPPMLSHTATLPTSDTQTSILGQLYSSYGDRERV